MLYFIDTGVNSSHSHILMVSDSAPHDNGAEVPIAGAHVLLEGQGVGADRHKPREDARMTMSREPGSRLLAYGRTRKSVDILPASAQDCCAARVTFNSAKSCEGADIMYVPTWFLSLYMATTDSKAKRSH